MTKFIVLALSLVARKENDKIFQSKNQTETGSVEIREFRLDDIKQGLDLRYLRRANWRGRFFGIYGFIEPDLETHCEKIRFFGIYGFIEPDLETRC